MIARSVLAAAALVLAAPVAGADQPVDGTISVTSSGWSQAPTRWSIAPDGSITDTRGEGQTIALPMTLADRHSGPSPDRYRRIRDLLAPVFSWPKSGKALPCKLYSTDASVGQVRWGAAPLVYYTGCGDKEGRPVIDGIVAASVQIGEWIKNEPVTARRELKTSEDMTAVTKEFNAP